MWSTLASNDTTTNMLARITAARRLPTVFTPILSRAMSDVRSEGSLAQSRGTFSKKEKAHEDEYARRHETEQLEKLKKQIEQKKAELSELEKEHEKVSSK